MDRKTEIKKQKTGRIWAAARLTSASEYQHAHTHYPHLTLSLLLALATFPQEKKTGFAMPGVKTIKAL